ncbi:MAG: mechanosensitive ion channel family protein [Gemmatimonadota bacterium]
MLQSMRAIQVVGIGAMALLAPLRTQSQGVADSGRPQEPVGSPVTLGVDTLFTLYGSLGPFSADQRAASASARIETVSADIAAGRDTLEVIEAGDHSEILAGGRVLMTVVEADAVPLGMRRDSVALKYARLVDRVSRQRAARTGVRALLLDALYASLLTAALVLVLVLLSRLFERVYRTLGEGRVPALKLQRFELLSSSRLAATLTVVARGIRVVITLLIAYVYLTLVLGIFPWTAPYARRVTAFVTDPLTRLGHGILAYIPSIMSLVIIGLVIRYLLKFIRLIFQGLATGTLVLRGFHRDWAVPTYKIVRFMVVALGVVVMIPYLPGSGSDAFKGVSIFVGLLFSFGSSSAIGNLMAGVVLTYTRAFQIGDRVQIGDTVGDVVERTLLVTRLRTIKNVEVTIPNGTVLSNHAVNYSAAAAARGLILHTGVTIGYDAPWRTVHELLIAAALKTEHVLPEPAPFVLQTALNDFFVSYEINAYTREARSMATIYSNLHQNIQDSFNAAGVEIMSPHFRAVRDGNARAMPPA